MNIWTNGCYDILHVGHIRLFEYAKSLGNQLHVGIDSDSRISLSKGENRPINKAIDRKEMLLSIKFIDSVDIFNSDEELENLIKIYHIDAIVIGEDYRNRRVVGSSLVDRVIFFPKVPDISSSIIYDAIQSRIPN